MAEHDGCVGLETEARVSLGIIRPSSCGPVGVSKKDVNERLLSFHDACHLFVPFDDDVFVGTVCSATMPEPATCGRQI